MIKKKWIVVIIVIILLSIAGLYYMFFMKNSYDFSDPKYETESFEIDYVNIDQLYESGFGFNCTVIKDFQGEEVNRPDRYMLIKDYRVLSFMPVKRNPSYQDPLNLSYTYIRFSTLKEDYKWRIDSNGSLKAITKFNGSLEYFRDPQKFFSKVVWLCQKIELSDDIFQPPEGLDFEAVTFSSLDDFDKVIDELTK